MLTVEIRFLQINQWLTLNSKDLDFPEAMSVEILPGEKITKRQNLKPRVRIAK